MKEEAYAYRLPDRINCQFYPVFWLNHHRHRVGDKERREHAFHRIFGGFSLSCCDRTARFLSPAESLEKIIGEKK